MEKDVSCKQKMKNNGDILDKIDFKTMNVISKKKMDKHYRII